MSLYRGYIPTSNKKSMMPFKDKSSGELMSLEQARTLSEYAGILNTTTVLVDIDTEAETEILLNIVKAKQLKCRVLKSRSGGHFLFKTDTPLVNRTHIKLAIGITADIKGAGAASYEVLKIDGKERDVLYDSGEENGYQLLPKYLYPVKTNMELLNMAEGSGRNNALFSYILPLQQNEFTVEECRECIRVINEFVLKDPLSESELSVIIRDGAFEKPTFFNSKGAFLFDKFAKYLVQAENIIKLNGKLYIYRDGIYETGDNYLESAMIEHIPNLKRNQRQEVLSYLSLLISKDRKPADANLIAFKNGVLNLADDSFNEFSPEYVLTNKIPHNYNPDAKSELLDGVLKSLACNDESVHKLLLQCVGYSFYRRNELRKSFIFTGTKRNGKSTFLDMLQTLLGEDNISNLDLCDIGSQFRTAEINGKLANIGDDINDEWVSNVSILKKVISGDVITAERKSKDPFKLRSYCKFFFSANSIPRLGRGKDSAAILDRLVIIPFDAKFSKGDGQYDPFIKYKLRDEAVMEALIAMSIPALKEVLAEQEFEECKKVVVSLNEFERSNDPLMEFFEDLNDSDYLNEPLKFVYQKYNSFCLGNNLQPISAIEFQKRMKNQFGVMVKVVETDGKKCRVYTMEG